MLKGATHPKTPCVSMLYNIFLKRDVRSRAGRTHWGRWGERWGGYVRARHRINRVGDVREKGGKKLLLGI